MHAWIDIDTPPQVQFLLPFKNAFEEAGLVVTITARDFGITHDLLKGAVSDFVAVGTSFGKSRRKKAVGSLRRARDLVSLFGELGKPDFLLCASRSSALAARALRADSFVLGDYEHSHVATYRLSGSYLLYPDVVDPRVYRQRGIRADRLIPFRGIKEDISFAAVDVEAATAFELPAHWPKDAATVLFRPPAEESHYYQSESRAVALATLRYLAARDDATVIFTPRYPWQREYLDRWEWANSPLLLTEPVPFLSLLKAVDLVVSSGGTMLREAAYLGIQAYSIFRSKIGAVDLFLESIGRVTFISDAGEVSKLDLTKQARKPVLRSNPVLLDELADEILFRTGLRRTEPAAA